MNVEDKLHPPGKSNVFGLPKGVLGIIAGWLMGRMSVDLNEWAVSMFDVQPNDRVLEIGFGPGVGIQKIAELAVHGFVSGIDPSGVMIRQASKRNADSISAGRVGLIEGSVSSLPYEDRSFDKVLSVNNIMLWPELEKNMKEVRRVMKPGGRLVIALNPRWAKTTQDVEDMGREIVEHVSRGGFVHTNTEFRKLKPVCAVVVTAVAEAS
jgi:ubiquinone/menaquinone biosynthesis C-methylase UbiE